jgi:hypothetical protein
MDTGFPTDAPQESDVPEVSAPTCMTSSDCASGTECLFMVGDCSAQGQCLAPYALGPICNIVVSYCGCDGQTVSGLCGPNYAYGPTLGLDSPCGPPVVVTPGATLTTLAVEEGSAPTFLAVDANNVYWTASVGFVLKVSVRGGAVVTLASGQSDPVGIAVDSANVYWANDGTGATGSVMKVPLGGGTPTTLASVKGTPYEVAIDATHVFWTNFATDAGVMQVPIAGGAATVLAATTESWAIAVQGANVFYTDGDNVLTVGVDGGTPVTLASGQADPYSLAADAISVYWSNIGSPDPALLKAPIGGGTPVTLVSGMPAHIAVDGTSVYFTSQGTGPNDMRVMSVPIGGGTPTTLVNGQSAAEGVAVYGKNVYWVDTSLGAVMKLTLP